MSKNIQLHKLYLLFEKWMRNQPQFQPTNGCLEERSMTWPSSCSSQHHHNNHKIRKAKTFFCWRKDLRSHWDQSTKNRHGNFLTNVTVKCQKRLVSRRSHKFIFDFSIKRSLIHQTNTVIKPIFHCQFLSTSQWHSICWSSTIYHMDTQYM